MFFQERRGQMYSARETYSINDVLYWVTALPACEYILMAISFCNFPFLGGLCLIENLTNFHVQFNGRWKEIFHGDV